MAVAAHAQPWTHDPENAGEGVEGPPPIVANVAVPQVKRKPPQDGPPGKRRALVPSVRVSVRCVCCAVCVRCRAHLMQLAAAPDSRASCVCAV